MDGILLVASSENAAEDLFAGGNFR